MNQNIVELIIVYVRKFYVCLIFELGYWIFLFTYSWRFTVNPVKSCYWFCVLFLWSGVAYWTNIGNYYSFEVFSSICITAQYNSSFIIWKHFITIGIIIQQINSNFPLFVKNIISNSAIYQFIIILHIILISSHNFHPYFNDFW